MLQFTKEISKPIVKSRKEQIEKDQKYQQQHEINITTRSQAKKQNAQNWFSDEKGQRRSQRTALPGKNKL